jgi:hypothetical protein
MLAGWLFADLLLVLFVTAFASLPAPRVMSSPHPGSTATPTPTPTPRPQLRVLEQNPQTFTVADVSPTAVASSDATTKAAAVAKLLGELRTQLADRKLQGRQAGFVIVFAYGPLDGISRAISAANSVWRTLKTEAQFKGIAGQGYWSGSAGFEFKIFFFA